MLSRAQTCIVSPRLLDLLRHSQVIVATASCRGKQVVCLVDEDATWEYPGRW
jgi:hypothetical protein